MVRLTVCGVIFVLLVAVKLLFPQTAAAQLHQREKLLRPIPRQGEGVVLHLPIRQRQSGPHVGMSRKAQLFFANLLAFIKHGDKAGRGVHPHRQI